MRWLGATLGPARDWDVFATHTLSGILPHLADPSLRKDGGRLRYRVTRMRTRLRKEAIAAVTSTRFTLLMLRAGLYLLALQRPTGAPDAAGQSARAFAREMLTRHSASLRKRGKGLRAATPARRHRARIAAKRLRYAAEFFMPLFTQRRAREYVKALAHLQGVLGQLNDIATAQGLVDRIAPPGAPAPHAAGMVRGWAAAAAGYEAARIDKAWKSFARFKPFWN
jgi:triphosphatase